jgi:S-adenosylmethionine hydrolase
VAALVTLTTDFGTRDGYVAEMKAVILGLARDVQFVDVTHEIAPQAVRDAALVLEIAPAFPPGTIHLAVVDPGVGTDRRGLVVAAGGHVYVGPDNGVFTAALSTEGWEAFALAAADLRRPIVSRTFHGRDVFAPAVAHLALGVPPARFGPPVSDPVRLRWPVPRIGAGWVGGEVLHVDRFGNLVTSLTAREVGELAGPVTVTLRGARLRLVETYAELARHEAGALIGSAGRLEIAVREGRADSRLRAGPGTRIVLRGGEALRRVPGSRATPVTRTRTTRTTRTSTRSRAKPRPST